MEQVDSEAWQQLRRDRDSYQAISQRLGRYTEELEGEMRRLRATCEREGAVIAALGEPLLVIDPQERILRCNAAAAQLFDIALSHDAADPLLCASIITCSRCFRDACPLAANASAECEVSIDNGEGAAQVFLVSAHPIHGAGGRIDATVLLFKDITVRQEMYDELMSEFLELAKQNTEQHN